MHTWQDVCFKALEIVLLLVTAWKSWRAHERSKENGQVLKQVKKIVDGQEERFIKNG